VLVSSIGTTVGSGEVNIGGSDGISLELVEGHPVMHFEGIICG
jgi:hypothetical protein